MPLLISCTQSSCVNPHLNFPLYADINVLQERPDDRPSDDAPLTVPYEEADHMMVHHFFTSHADAVGRDLLRFRGILQSRRSPEMIPKANTTWKEICSVIVDLGPVARYPSLIKMSGPEHPRYGEFVLRNAARDTQSVESLFYELSEERTDTTATFIFHLNRVDVELVEPNVLSIHILQVNIL